MDSVLILSLRRSTGRAVPRSLACLALVSLIALIEPTQGQTTGNRSSQPNRGSVSQDLLDTYALTRVADTQAKVTDIARTCSAVVTDTRRSRTDRKYASSLFAWALNRRGEMRNDQAAELVEAGRIDEAAKLDAAAAEDYRTAIQYGPANWRTFHNYAISLAMQGKYRLAIEQFDETIKLNPEYANAFFNRAELHFELGDFQSAIADYDRAIERDESDGQFYNSRGHSYFLLEHFSAALDDYAAAIQLSPKNVEFHTDLADAHHYLGNWQQAAEAYRSAVAVNNQYARAFQNAAWLMATCPDVKYRKSELAISAAKKAITLQKSEDAKALDTLAAAYASAGQFDTAEKTLAKAIDIATKDVRAELALRADLYSKRQPFRQPSAGANRQETTSDSQIRTASGPSDKR
ncbi:MAG TPA: hypothetical protein DDW52_12630 [Planctomycetaceae bacterium]|nr:hypothetical protein [Planctomycetaceae bacterium]